MSLVPFLFVVAITLATIGLGLYATRKAQSASDFFVAGRQVSVFMNASAISGEYLSAASFMGIAGLVMKNGYDALWYPVGYAAGYLLLLLFIAGPLRRFGAYTIPDFAEGRFDSPTFRKVAVLFVLCIGFFYTMPQMKGAGVTMSTILNWPYWAGIAVVGGVITFNVALGGMKGITFVQAFQYWAKAFAISAPLFVLMNVYGGYGASFSKNVAAPADAPHTTENRTVKIPGKDKAPANAVTFSAQGRALLVVNGATLDKVSPVPPTADAVPDDALVASLPVNYNETDIDVGNHALLALAAEHNAIVPPLPEARTPIEQRHKRVSLVRLGTAAQGAELPNGTTLWATPYALTSVTGKPGTGTVKVEFASPTEAMILGGSYIPNSPANKKWMEPYGTLTGKHGYPLLYTYSLIIALVCGTAGLPHILVRFYTNPDGRAAKRTTFWVMVLLGAFYVFTPVWGTLGRSLLPELYANNRTDAVVIALPRILENKLLGEVLSGITSAGAFAAFMSTFSGLLVSMSGAWAHDIYGKMLNPRASTTQRLTAFKLGAVVFGVVSMLLGLLVESFDITLMVGWAFAIAAASYFPLLLLGAWWRGLTRFGAAAGMLTGGTLSLLAILTFMGIEKKWLPFDAPPLVKALLEQPAIWGVPLSLGIMIVISLATARHLPRDINGKMLRLHAPEEMGYSKNYVE
ncbi:MAG: cation acetate symporter [Cytophagales bacterium]|nr:cation acetate symporter [Armatimonadota bacterium]